MKRLWNKEHSVFYSSKEPVSFLQKYYETEKKSFDSLDKYYSLYTFLPCNVHKISVDSFICSKNGLMWLRLAVKVKNIMLGTFYCYFSEKKQYQMR